MKWFWRTIWNFCEMYKIDLGRFAPYVFGKMLSCKKYKKITKKGNK